MTSGLVIVHADCLSLSANHRPRSPCRASQWETSPGNLRTRAPDLTTYQSRRSTPEGVTELLPIDSVLCDTGEWLDNGEYKGDCSVYIPAWYTCYFFPAWYTCDCYFWFGKTWYVGSCFLSLFLSLFWVWYDCDYSLFSVWYALDLFKFLRFQLNWFFGFVLNLIFCDFFVLFS